MSIYSSFKSLPYVYKCINKITHEYYFGYREKNVKLNLPSHIDFPKYKTSSKKVRPYFEQFEWIILAEFFDSDSAYDFEQQLIKEHWNDPLLLNDNCRTGSKRFKGKIKHSEKSLSKMKECKRGNKNPMFGKTGINNSLYGKKQTEEFIKKRINGMKGHYVTDNTREKISNSLKGIPKEQIKCPHCNKIGGKSPMLRWHFTNCKEIHH